MTRYLLPLLLLGCEVEPIPWPDPAEKIAGWLGCDTEEQCREGELCGELIGEVDKVRVCI